ncbi:MAG: phage holin family protein [Gammaproteobacteria bacterium]
MSDSYVSPDEELGEGGGEEPPSRSAGFMDSAKRMLATLLALVHTRLELFTTEIEEEIQRAASILMWALVALFFGSLTVLMVAFTVIIIFWDDHRVLAAVLVSATFLVMTLIFGLLARSRLKAKTRFMAASIEELKRDRESLDRMTSN